MPGLREAFDRIGAFLEDRLPRTHAAGAALSVTDGEDVLGVVVRGFADAGSATPVGPDTRFEIGSISKSFAALVCLQEAERGRLDLHVPITEVLPWLELPMPYGPITLHHLLSHTSGLLIGTDDSADATFAAWNLRHFEPGFAPGERFLYSNDGYKLVGLALERVTGERIDELLRARIFEPLGMIATTGVITDRERARTATGYVPSFDDRPAQSTFPLVPAPWTPSISADGSIVSSVVDMSAYIRMLLGRGTGPSGELVSPAGYARMVDRAIAFSDDGQEGFYGYGLWTREWNGRTLVEHSGGMVGFTSLMTLDPDAGLGVMVCLNGYGMRRDIADFALDAVRAALAGDPLPEVTPLPPASATPDAESYAGTYRGPSGDIDLVAEHGGLVLVRDGRRTVLEPEHEKPGIFLVPDPDLDRFHLRCVREGDGPVTEVTLGPERYLGEAFDGPAGDEGAPAQWSSVPGHYRSNNPWYPGFRIVPRGGRLWLCGPYEERALVHLRDATFRIGEEPWSPDRLTVDVVLEGRALRVLVDGAAYYRSFLP